MLFENDLGLNVYCCYCLVAILLSLVLCLWLWASYVTDFYAIYPSQCLPEFLNNATTASRDALWIVSMDGVCEMQILPDMQGAFGSYGGLDVSYINCIYYDSWKWSSLDEANENLGYNSKFTEGAIKWETGLHYLIAAFIVLIFLIFFSFPCLIFEKSSFSIFYFAAGFIINTFAMVLLILVYFQITNTSQVNIFM